jgi:adhesin transport system membrane fusion protein
VIQKPSVAANSVLLVITGVVITFIVWASLTQLDQVTRGQGRIVPSSQLQVIQNLEGGIVSEILVRQGDRVKKGDVLMRLDRTQFGAELEANRGQYWRLVARIVRLKAESQRKEPEFPAALREAAPETLASEMTLYRARVKDTQAQIQVLESQRDQRQRELEETLASRNEAQKSAELARQEVEMLEPLVARDIQPQIDLVRARQKAVAADGDYKQAGLAISRLQEAVKEAELAIVAAQDSADHDAVEKLAEAQNELVSLGESLPALEDRVARTEVTAPIDGIVNRVLVTTIGGVAKPGMPLMEIVPVEDSLLVEADIRPEDIGFIRPGLKARVKLTAYDYVRYGALEVVVETVGADAVVNDAEQRVYRIRVRTADSVLRAGGQDLTIIPGMVAEVDVLNGKRSIISYILTPIERGSERALREN